MRRLAALPRLPFALPISLPRPTRRMAVGALLTVAVLVPGWFWLRDSPLVSVEHVNVTGLSGPQANEVREAILTAAKGMTTLHVQPGKVDDAVREYPIVAGVTVHAHLLHTLDVSVRQYTPVGALSLHGGHHVAVASDGTILEGQVTQGLPIVPISVTPGGPRLIERKALDMVALLAAAPAELRDRVTSVALDEHGLVAHLRDGPDLYFGPGLRLRAKWISAARVLGDFASRGTTYLDLRVPERPAAGGADVSEATGTAVNSQAEVQTSQ